MGRTGEDPSAKTGVKTGEQRYTTHENVREVGRKGGFVNDHGKIEVGRHQS
jgi:hypothetical protein